MCNQWCLDFVRGCSDRWLPDANILEVGSLDVNGSPRSALVGHTGKYIGVDVKAGPGVDLIMSTYDLAHNFSVEKFDVVISTEMLEHVKDWKLAVYQMALVLKIGGWLCLTTRSPGFEYHEYPYDCWRFTLEHMKQIFHMPMELVHIEPDPDLRQGRYSGVGVLVRRTEGSLERWREALRHINVATPA